MVKTARIIVLLVLLITIIQTIGSVGAYPITVTDCYGDDIVITEKPERIVSLSPSNTEILFAIGAGDTVVGVTSYDTYPPEVFEIEVVGGYVNVDNEKILDLEPDLVLAYYANGNETIAALKDLGLKVVTRKPETMDEIMDEITLFGEITDHESEAASVVSNMNTVIEQIKTSTAAIAEEGKPGVLYVVSMDPMYVAGKGTFPSDMIELSGGRNIVEADGWTIFTLEDIVDKNPQVIICSGMGGLGDEIYEEMNTNSVVAVTDAARQKQIHVLSDSNLVERPGPRIVQGLEEIYSYIQPVAQAEEQEEITEQNDSSEIPDVDNTVNSTPGFGFLIAALMVLFSVSLIRSQQK
jgi:iron complex transport system substrate-binding protein